MYARLLRLVAIYFTYVILFILGKLVFILINGDIYSGISFAGVIEVLRHGFSMDSSMAAYLTTIPAIVLTAGVWARGRWPGKVICVWRYLSIALILCTIGLDSVLYGYWNFKLDTTPVFYFLTSPASAMASVSLWVPVAGIFAVGILTAAIGKAAGKIWNIPALKPLESRKPTVTAFIVLLLLTGALFIPIRGGFTVSTMNPSAAYFSTEARMNHAAVNPMFSFMYSATHSSDFSKQFRYYTQEELHTYLDEIYAPADSTGHIDLLSVARPDIYIVILESFSSHLMPGLGGEPVAMRLDCIAHSGVTFTNFYASSFRTDRAIPAILSGYPAQPSTSVMKFVDKAENLPSLAATLRDSAGYEPSYYYGGDINFVNQKAYLVSGGYDNIISDKDFPISDRLSKWGAHDDKVWQRLYEDVENDSSLSPKFRVIQTSSSHEPFEVPYTNEKLKDSRAVAFAYADSCLGNFVDRLRESGKWDNALLVIVPDHWGAYPQGLTQPVERHRIPLVLTGGALKSDVPATIDSPGSQNDIAATLMGQLGISSKAFPMSQDLLDLSVNHFAFFSEPDFAAFVSRKDTVVVSTHDDSMLIGSSDKSYLPKAFLQNLYIDLDAK